MDSILEKHGTDCHHQLGRQKDSKPVEQPGIYPREITEVL